MADYAYDGQEAILVVDTPSDSQIQPYAPIYAAANVALLYAMTVSDITTAIADPRCRIGLIMQNVAGVSYQQLVTKQNSSFYILLASTPSLVTSSGASGLISNAFGANGNLTVAHTNIAKVAQYLELLATSNAV